MKIDFRAFCVVKDLSNTRQEKNQLEKIGSNNRRFIYYLYMQIILYVIFLML